MQHLIVPVDGSDVSWRAVDVASALALRCDATIDVVEVVFSERDEVDAVARAADRIATHVPAGVTATSSVRAAADAADVIGDLLGQRPESTIVMASHGRGRSAAVMGSVVEDVLRLVYGPVVVVGPHAVPSDFSGPIIVTVDGSAASEAALPLAAAWGIELGAEPWVVEVADPRDGPPPDVDESTRAARLARDLAVASGHPVQFEMLHGDNAAKEVTDHAQRVGASLIVATTHGRTGLSRFVVGSTAAGFVRHAGCPVLLVRPPHLATG